MINEVTVSFFDWIDRVSKNKYYPLSLGLVLILSSWFLVYPKFFSPNLDALVWQNVMLKVNDLTNSLEHIDPYSWQSKKVFRLTVPVIMRLANLSPLAIIIIQVFVGYLIHVFTFLLAKRILKDPVSATFLSAGLAFLYFGRTAYYDINFAWFDAFAYFFLVLALYSKTIFPVFLFSTLAAWTDERAFISLLIVFIFHQMKGRFQISTRLSDFFSLNKAGASVIIAMTLYLALRLLLSYIYDMDTITEGINLQTIKKTSLFMPIGIWTFLEGFWLICIVALLHSFAKKYYLITTLFVLPIIVLTTVSGCVTDITRSGSFLVPMIFVSVAYINEHQSKKESRPLLLVCFIISLLYPATIICADWDVDNWVLDSSIIHIGRSFIK